MFTTCLHDCHTTSNITIKRLLMGLLEKLTDWCPTWPSPPRSDIDQGIINVSTDLGPDFNFTDKHNLLTKCITSHDTISIGTAYSKHILLQKKKVFKCSCSLYHRGNTPILYISKLTHPCWLFSSAVSTGIGFHWFTNGYNGKVVKQIYQIHSSIIWSHDSIVSRLFEPCTYS